MMLLCLTSEDQMKYLKNISTCSVGTGLLGKMGNKGGVGIRFEYFNSSFCVINSHLAAHTEYVARRNQDFHDISSRMIFSSFTSSIYDHDILFWMGDLNYRIDGIAASTIRQWSHDQKFHNLFQYDQVMT